MTPTRYQFTMAKQNIAKLMITTGLVAGLFVTSPALAPPKAFANETPVQLSATKETIFRADEVVNYSDLSVTVLRGNVEIAQAGQVLTADTVSYNREADTLTASGNVVLMQPDGTVLFSTYMEITSDGFKNGVIENIRLLLTENARVAANGARRSDGNRTEMRKAVYSPCDVCRKNPDEAPLWQVKADRITHDEEKFLLQYENMWLEFAGVPVFYSPYFQHYDPRVERKSGLLIPSFGSSAGLGRFLQPRYFWAIDPSKDFLFEPILGSTGSSIAAGRYRQRFDRGELEANFSLGHLPPVTNMTEEDKAIAGEELIDGDTWRGHMQIGARYHIDDTWRANLNLNRVTDPSYGRAYPLFDIGDTQLVSTASLEGFRARNYASVEMLAIQSLRTDVPSGFREPQVIPRINYNGRGHADRFGGRWQLDTEMRLLANEKADDLHRFTLAPGYGFSKILPAGFKADFEANIQANAYIIEQDYSAANRGSKSFKYEGVAVPKSSLKLTYPFARIDDTTAQTITPIVFGTVSPEVDPPNDISVFEDVTTFERDEINLFTADQLNGDDALDSGSRLAAGGRYNIVYQNMFQFDALLARMIAESSAGDLDDRLNLQRNSDDWVGGIKISHDDYGTLSYRTRMGELPFNDIRRHSAYWNFGPRYLRLNGSYQFVSDDSNGPIIDDLETINLGFSGSFKAPAPCQTGSATWSYGLYSTRDLTAETTRNVSGSLAWQNECASITFYMQREFTEVLGRGKKLDTFLATISLKTLGEYEF